MKKLILNSSLCTLAICLVLLCGCNQKKDVIDFNKFSEEFLKAYNSHDAAALSKFYTEDAILRMPGEPMPVQGRKAIEESYAYFFRAFPDLTIKFVTIIANSDQVCFEFVETGTFTGPMATPAGDIPPTGKSCESKGAFFAKVTSAGLISEDRTYYDVESFKKQVGLQ